jgi:ADP-ribosylglycohydrolase
VSEQLGNGIAAVESCVTAVYIALRFLGESFSEMQTFVAACGGDVDTIGAMAGAVWGAVNGASSLPSDRLLKLEQRDRLLAVAGALHERTKAFPQNLYIVYSQQVARYISRKLHASPTLSR